MTDYIDWTKIYTLVGYSEIRLEYSSVLYYKRCAFFIINSGSSVNTIFSDSVGALTILSLSLE